MQLKGNQAAQEARHAAHAQPLTAHKPETGGGGGSGGGGGGAGSNLHPLIQGLLMTLPKVGDAWSVKDRLNWLTLANTTFKMIYSTDQAQGDIALTDSGDDVKIENAK